MIIEVNVKENYQVEWKERLDKLKSMHKDIADYCLGKKLAYLDIPMHFNVGDLLIYAGTEQFIRDYSLNVTYRGFDSGIDHKELRKVDIILIHGGGNFGDLYPRHQIFKEEIVTKYPDKKIIFLPQTIYFKDNEEKVRSASIFKKHNDLHIFVRDDRSLELAKEFSNSCNMMPDMAHSLHPLIDHSEVENIKIDKFKILNLRRIDIENVSLETDISKKTFDWDHLITNEDKIHLRLSSKLNLIPFLRKKILNKWHRRADVLIFRSINFFYQFNVVYTDRLHGAILAYLLGKNIKLIDNSYGKNTGYYTNWLDDKFLIKNISLNKNEKN